VAVEINVNLVLFEELKEKPDGCAEARIVMFGKARMWIPRWTQAPPILNHLSEFLLP